MYTTDHRRCFYRYLKQAVIRILGRSLNMIFSSLPPSSSFLSSFFLITIIIIIFFFFLLLRLRLPVLFLFFSVLFTTAAIEIAHSKYIDPCRCINLHTVIRMLLAFTGLSRQQMRNSRVKFSAYCRISKNLKMSLLLQLDLKDKIFPERWSKLVFAIRTRSGTSAEHISVRTGSVLC